MCLCLSVFCLSRHVANRDLHSFPTRRSSDLISRWRSWDHSLPWLSLPAIRKLSLRCTTGWASYTGRSEEHTSELQSRVDLVCRLLLEKKKIRKTYVYEASIEKWKLRR